MLSRGEGSELHDFEYSVDAFRRIDYACRDSLWPSDAILMRQILFNIGSGNGLKSCLMAQKLFATTM